MSTNSEQPATPVQPVQSTAPVVPAAIAYPGPHDRIVLKGIPEFGEVTLVRGEVRDDLPPSVRLDLVQREKVEARTAADLKAYRAEQKRLAAEKEAAEKKAAAEKTEQAAH